MNRRANRQIACDSNAEGMGANCVSHGKPCGQPGEAYRSPRTPKAQQSRGFRKEWSRNFTCQDEDDVSRLTMWQHDVEALKEDLRTAWVSEPGSLDLDVAAKPGSLEAPTAARAGGRSAAGSWTHGHRTVSHLTGTVISWPGSD